MTNTNGMVIRDAPAIKPQTPPNKINEIIAQSKVVISVLLSQKISIIYVIFFPCRTKALRPLFDMCVWSLLGNALFGRGPFAFFSIVAGETQGKKCAGKTKNDNNHRDCNDHAAPPS